MRASARHYHEIAKRRGLRAAAPVDHGGMLAQVHRAAVSMHPMSQLPRDLSGRARFLADVGRHWSLVRHVLTNPQPLLRDTLDRRPELLGLVTWPYIHNGWGVARRVEALEGHYREIEFHPELCLRIGESLTVADLSDVCDGLTIRIDRPHWFMREGELTLNLFVGESRVYSLAFSFALHEGRRIALVGAVQGWPEPEAKSLYVTMTHQLHGARPRDFLLQVFLMLCRVRGIATVRCIADACRHHRHPYFGKAPLASLKCNYDEIWRDRGGVLAGDGFFDLATSAPAKRLSEVPSKKRAMYRRRAELYARVEQAVSAQALRAQPRTSAD